MKKYDFTGKIKVVDGVELKQIVRLKDNLIGGWIEKEENLSQEGSCFVYDDSKVYDDALICDDAKVYDRSEVYGNARVYEDANVSGNVEISDNAEVYGYADIYGYAGICGNAKVHGTANVFGYAAVYDNSEIYDHASVCDNAEVYGKAKLHGDVRVYSKSLVHGNADISYGDIIGEVQIKHDDVYFYKSHNTRLVAAITKDGKTLFNVGCQKLINKEEFIRRIYNEDGGLEKNPHREFYLKILDLY